MAPHVASRCLVLREVKGFRWGYYVVGEGAVTTGVVVNCVTSPSEPTFPVARLLRASAVVAEVDTVDTESPVFSASTK